MKHLIIPKRDRKKGEYVYCSTCKTTVSKVCKKKGKALSTCMHPDSHQFLSRFSYHGKIVVKYWPKDLRNYDEFTRKHLNYQTHVKRGSHLKKVKELRPQLLKDCIRMYFDWYRDVDVPDYKKKRYTEKTVKGELANLSDLRQSQPDYETVLITDFNDYHVDLFHKYLVRKGFANKTYNNKLYTAKSLFNFLIEQKEYNLSNPFKYVKNKLTQADKKFIRPEDFQTLISIITIENGIKLEKDRNKIKRKSLYRDWLVDYYKLALYTGARPETISLLKVNDVKEDFISLFNGKVSRRKKSDLYHLVVRTEEFDEFYEEVISKYDLQSEDFLIAPKETNRRKIVNHASKAFTHYWSQLNVPYKATCYDLKDTHVTIMLKKFGSKYEGLYGAHDSFKTTLNNYAVEEEMIKELRGKKLLG